MNKKELIASLKQQGFSFKIINAFERVPREKFVPGNLREYAYEDIALPLEKGATISQPYTIAFMLNLLELQKGMKVLEIGSGSGYVCALINEMTKWETYGIEIIKPLAEKSKNILPELGYEKIEILCRDGSNGLVEKAPFDRILVSASAEEIPSVLISQLKNKGLLVIPVKDSIFQVKKNKGKIETKEFPGFAFVSLVGEG